MYRTIFRFPLAFDARMVGYSGIGTQVSGILGVLTRKKNVDLTLLGDPGPLRERFPDFRGRILDWNPPIYSLQEQWRLPPLPPGTMVHFPHYSAPLFLLHRHPALVCVHDLIHLQSKEFRRPHHRLYARLMLEGVLRQARVIVTVSDATRLELIQRFPFAAPRTYTIHNGLNHALYRPLARGVIDRFRGARNLPRDYLLAVGIGKQHKNIDFIFRALLPLWQSGRLKLPLVLGGTGGRLPAYARAAIAPGFQGVFEQFVILLPHIEESEMPALYGGARLLLYPSLLEGFGFPLVEAMACGTPVLAAHRASLPEVGGQAARYFNPERALDFTNVLLELLAKPAYLKKLRSAGLRRSREFDWERHVESLLGLYATLVPQP